jgi:hypothetical protein
MNQRTAFIVATMVTSFVLVAVGGVTASVANRAAAVTATATEPPTAQATPTQIIGIDPAVVAQREVAYQQQIAAANAQLKHAYQLQKALADELNSIPPSPAPKPRIYVQPTQSKPTYPVTPAMAGQLALNAVPGAVLLSTPELVLFEGKVAYEVVLDRGKIYIDATTGLVLYNGTTSPSSGNGGNSGSSGNSNPPPPPQHNSDGGGDGGDGGGGGGGDQGDGG